jgi:hypothetical protein
MGEDAFFAAPCLQGLAGQTMGLVQGQLRLKARVGMQTYRIEQGKLAETWVISSRSARHGTTPLRRTVGRAPRQ